MTAGSAETGREGRGGRAGERRLTALSGVSSGPSVVSLMAFSGRPNRGCGRQGGRPGGRAMRRADRRRQPRRHRRCGSRAFRPTAGKLAPGMGPPHVSVTLENPPFEEQPQAKYQLPQFDTLWHPAAGIRQGRRDARLGGRGEGRRRKRARCQAVGAPQANCGGGGPRARRRVCAGRCAPGPARGWCPPLWPGPADGYCGGGSRSAKSPRPASNGGRSRLMCSEPITKRGQGRFFVVPRRQTGRNELPEVARLPPLCDGLRSTLCGMRRAREPRQPAKTGRGPGGGGRSATPTRSWT
jgi:hypothetical protein